MGTYLNPGKAAYQMAVNSEIYIDKTEMIQYINSVVNTQQRFVSVSRPRRFGKTIAANMLCAYYDREADSHKLFESHKVAGTSGWDEYHGKFDVIYLVMTRFFKSRLTVSEALSNMQKLVIRDLKRTYPDIDLPDDNDLIQTIYDVYSTTGKQAVVIIDEWDAVFRERPNDKEGQEEYLDYLRDLLKDNSYIALAYMTGILPIKKYGQHSALNMFTEYSMMAPRQLAPYTGFTEEEVVHLCDEHKMSFSDMKHWYDGYSFDEIGHIYCPNSVIEALNNRKIKNYWTKTETYELLMSYIAMNFDGLKQKIVDMLAGGRCKIDSDTFQNDMTSFKSADDIITLLIHLGYLAYDIEKEQAYIPNNEVRSEMVRAVKADGWDEVYKAITDSEKLLKATWAMEEDKVAKMIHDVHTANSSSLVYNNEVSLSSIIMLAYYSAAKDYTVIRELPTGEGFADMVFIPKRSANVPAMIVELKWDKSAEGAIGQIKDKGYVDALKEYKGNLLLVGINYDKKTRVHQCKIEKYEME